MSWVDNSNLRSATFVAASSRSFSVADNASLSITGDITIEAWVKITNAPGSGTYYTIVSKWNDAAAGHSYDLYYRNEAGTKELDFYTSSTGSDTRDIKYTVDLGTATWHHIAVKVSGGTGTFYVDGTAHSPTSGSAFSSLYDSTIKFRIGADGDSGDSAANFLDGQLDDVRIWNVARSDANITANYQTQIAAQANLVGYWKFNESSGNAADSSGAFGGSSTLTNNNGVTYTTDPAFSYTEYDGTLSETAGAPVETLTLTNTIATVSDTAGTPVETLSFKRLFGNTAKSSAPTWSNTSKS